MRPHQPIGEGNCAFRRGLKPGTQSNGKVPDHRDRACSIRAGGLFIRLETAEEASKNVSTRFAALTEATSLPVSP